MRMLLIDYRTSHWKKTTPNKPVQKRVKNFVTVKFLKPRIRIISFGRTVKSNLILTSRIRDS